MKKIIAVFLFLSIIGVNIYSIPSPIQLTFDPKNWLTAIDSLYAIYDQIKTNVEQLRMQYEQIQQAAKAVQGWKFDEIKWDGDFDFRNEISDFTKSIDRQLSNIRNLQESLTAQNISIGGQNFSIADLVGAGEKGKTIAGFAEATYNWAKEEKIEKIRKAFEEGLSDAEYMAVFNKYGLRPANYMMVKQAEEQVKKQIGRVIAANSEIGSKKWIENQEKTYGPIFTVALKTEATPQQVNQAILMYEKQINESINLLRSNILEIGEMMAWNIQEKKQQKEAEEERRSMIQSSKESRYDISSMLLGGNPLRKNKHNIKRRQKYELDR